MHRSGEAQFENHPRYSMSGHGEPTKLQKEVKGDQIKCSISFLLQQFQRWINLNGLLLFFLVLCRVQRHSQALLNEFQPKIVEIRVLSAVSSHESFYSCYRMQVVATRENLQDLIFRSGPLPELVKMMTQHEHDNSFEAFR
jgi:hypothetical protein